MFHKRKNVRLKDYDYSTPGCYFITICTKNRQKLLCDIVGTGLPDGPDSRNLDIPEVRFTPYGEVAKKHLDNMSAFYPDLQIEKYVIMPNHIHLLIHVLDLGNGPSRTPVSTNNKISMFVGTLKRFCNKEYGRNIWQSRFHDHIIRNQYDYEKIWRYIENNPQKWEEDCFYEDELSSSKNKA